jgi:predicted DNA-binding transcriptional regulator AlpA
MQPADLRPVLHGQHPFLLPTLIKARRLRRGSKFGRRHGVIFQAAPTAATGLDPVVTLSQLASQLDVSVQTLYDLRSQGRGPRGFRVGRELRFRVREVDVWLAQMEADDAERHPRQVG